MFREELKAELKQNYDSIKTINKEIINIKVAIHNLVKLGLDTKDFNKFLAFFCVKINPIIAQILFNYFTKITNFYVF